jgi:hypothetical protein
MDLFDALDISAREDRHEVQILGGRPKEIIYIDIGSKEGSE